MPAAPKLSALSFGSWLETRRGERSHEQIAREVRKYVADIGMKVHASAIVKYEQGRIPPWPILYAFSRVYRTTPAAIATRLFGAIKVSGGRDLVRHSAVEGSATEVADVPASDGRAQARILELESQLAGFEDLKAQFGEVQDVARKLWTLTASEEDRKTAGGKAGGGKPAGKTRRRSA